MTQTPATLPDTLDALTAVLSAADPSAEVVFHTSQGEIGHGYHVTELKLANVQSIDCGGRRNAWTEAQLQLLDGRDGERLTAGKVAAILSRSRDALPGLGEVPLSVEFANGNDGLGIYQIGAPEVTEGALRLPLTAGSAMCKPAAEYAANGQSSCCGPASKTTSASSCCGTPASAAPGQRAGACCG